MAKNFLFGDDKPLSYTQVRRMCNCIKWDLEFEENITPIRFCTTVLTDVYEQMGDINLAPKGRVDKVTFVLVWANKRDALWRHPAYFIIRFRFMATADKRQ